MNSLKDNVVKSKKKKVKYEMRREERRKYDEIDFLEVGVLAGDVLDGLDVLIEELLRGKTENEFEETTRSSTHHTK